MSQYYIWIMLAGPLIGAITAWAASRANYKKEVRVASGNIDTTDARTIWEQVNKLIQDMRAEITRLTESNRRLEESNTKLEEESRDLRVQIDRLTTEIGELRVRLGT